MRSNIDPPRTETRRVAPSRAPRSMRAESIPRRAAGAKPGSTELDDGDHHRREQAGDDDHHAGDPEAWHEAIEVMRGAVPTLSPVRSAGPAASARPGARSAGCPAPPRTSPGSGRRPG